MPESDHDILVRLDQRVEDIHRDMTQPEGRVPKLETKVEDHATKINTFKGSVNTLVWILGGVGLLLVTLAGVVMAHILGGK